MTGDDRSGASLPGPLGPVAARAVPSAEVLAERCRAAGLKATPQRLAIFQALLRTDRHPSPEALYACVKEILPSISLGTVYKTLDSLEEAGLIAEVAQLFQTKRYDANEAPHHHLICTGCGAITDFNHPSLDNLSPPVGIEGFGAREMRIQILGLCASCAARGATSSREDVAARGPSRDDAPESLMSRNPFPKEEHHG